MIKTIVAAIAANGVIGRNNGLPWKMDSDWEFYRKLTWKKPLLMGRKSFESLPGGFVENTVFLMTSNRNYESEGRLVCISNVAEGFKSAENQGIQELFVVGGASIYQQALHQADRLLITEIEADVEGDAYFPTIDLSCWKRVRAKRHDADEGNEYPYVFVEYQRI